jgi:hypothetical protein
MIPRWRPSTPDADRHEDGSTVDTRLAHDAGVRAGGCCRRGAHRDRGRSVDPLS